jgi:hypothetical protein
MNKYYIPFDEYGAINTIILQHEENVCVIHKCGQTFSKSVFLIQAIGKIPQANNQSNQRDLIIILKIAKVWNSKITNSFANLQTFAKMFAKIIAVQKLNKKIVEIRTGVNDVLTFQPC